MAQLFSLGCAAARFSFPVTDYFLPAYSSQSALAADAVAESVIWCSFSVVVAVFHWRIG